MTVLRLNYRGDGAFRPGLPARDLDHADLAALMETQKRTLDEIVAEAVGSGLYVAVDVEDDVPQDADDEDAESGDATPADPLEDPQTTRPVLVAMAEDLGLAVASRDTKAVIAAAIRAERQRLADAAAETADSGEGDQGGDATPADDSGATAPDEAGTPPAEGDQA